MSDVPEELAAEIPDPIFIQIWWEDAEALPSFSFGGMSHYEFKGRLQEFWDDIRNCSWAQVEEDNE